MSVDRESHGIPADQHTDKRHSMMAALSRGRILDIGFADLPNVHLSNHTIGLDLKRTSKPPNYREVVVNHANQICFASAAFDTVIAGEVIEHLEEPVRFLRNCRRVLTLGGCLILSTPNPYYPPIILLNWLLIRRFFFSADHLYEIAPRHMARLLENTGYRSVRMISGGIPLPLGKDRNLHIPSPRAVCYHIVYVAEAA